VLETISRKLIRGLLAVFTIVVLLLVQSIFWTGAVSVWMRIIVIAVALVAYFRPQNCLLLLAAMIPLGQVGSRTLNSDMRGAEALVLAFLAGALSRGWTLREFRSFPSTRVEAAALVFGLIVAASCLEQIWFIQIQQDWTWPFTHELLSYASEDYLTSVGGFRMIFHAMLLLEGLALLLFVTHHCRSRAEFPPRLVQMLVIGAIAAGAVSVIHLLQQVEETRAPLLSVLQRAARERTPPHVGDINAAASYFGMAAMMTSVLSFLTSRHRRFWLAAAFFTAVVLWSTGSRTAIVCILIIGAAAAARGLSARSRNGMLTLALSGLILLIGGAVILRYFPVSFVAGTALSSVASRWMLLGTTMRMLAAEPLFGIGIGQYYSRSLDFSSPELVSILMRHENAHNQFAQITGELGLAGLAAFLAVLAVSLFHGAPERRRDPVVTATLSGLAVFILTWIGGHPLLVPEVSYPFWIGLGVAGALAESASKTNSLARIVGFSVALLAISIPWRVGIKSAFVESHG
jgi:hypothetical protein